MKYFITFKLTFEGIHAWPGAPDRVDFLRDPHRHVFHVTGKRYVEHADRDTEFISLKHDVKNWLAARWQVTDGISQMGSTSCEMVAAQLASVFKLATVHVTEDGENGGGVEL